MRHIRRSAVSFIAAALTLAGCSKTSVEPSNPTRVRDLAEKVESRRKSLDADVDAYRPAAKGDINGPALVEIFRQLPGVASVEVLVAAPNPTHRIVHIRDWHHVPRDLYAVDIRQAAGKALSDQEVEQLHREFLLEVELIQLEQECLLRCLARHHGLKRLLSEGLTAAELGAYRAKVSDIQDLRGKLPAMKQDAAALRTGDAAALKKGIDDLDQDLRLGLLELGAPARLAIAEGTDVLPLDDEVSLHAASPVREDKIVKIDPATAEARHDSQVQAAIGSGQTSVLVLGGAHDLSASVKKLSGGTVEYIQVTTSSYPR